MKMKLRLESKQAIRSVVALAVLCAGSLAWFAMARTSPLDGPTDEPPAPVATPALLSEKRDELKAIEDRVRRLRDDLKLELSDIRIERGITFEMAQADYELAKRQRMVAEVEVRVFEEGTYPEQEQEALGRLALANSNQERVREAFDWSERMFGEGLISEVEFLGAKLALQKALYEAMEAETRLGILQEFTKEARIKELQAAVELARANEITKSGDLAGAKARMEQSFRHVEQFNLLAPDDLVLALYRAAVADEKRRVEILREIGRMDEDTDVEVEDHDAFAKQLEGNQREIHGLTEQIRQRLSEALALAEHVHARRSELLAAEEEWKQARDWLALAEALPEPIPGRDRTK